MTQQAQLIRVRICAYGDCYEIECDQNPLGSKAHCWGCTELCEAYRKLREEYEALYQRRLERLKQKVMELGGEIVEEGHKACLDCPEYPHECRYCQRSPNMWPDLAEPYVKAMFVWEGDEA